jgi:hypothetical protein
MVKWLHGYMVRPFDELRATFFREQTQIFGWGNLSLSKVASETFDSCMQTI